MLRLIHEPPFHCEEAAPVELFAGPSGEPVSSGTPGVDSVDYDRLRAELAAARTARDLAFDELVALQEAVARAGALCDLAEWAADAAGGSGGPVTVRADELRAALRPRID